MADERDTSAVMLDGARARAYQRAEADDGLQAMRALCRAHTPKAIEAVAGLLSHPDGRTVIAAARYLTEYGYGRPAPAPEEVDVVAEIASRPLVGVSIQHLLALAGAPTEDAEGLTAGAVPRIEQRAPSMDVETASRVLEAAKAPQHDFSAQGNEVARVADSVERMQRRTSRRKPR